MFHIFYFQIENNMKKVGISVRQLNVQMLPPCWLITVATEARLPGSLDSTVLAGIDQRVVSPSQSSSHNSGVSLNLLRVAQPMVWFSPLPVVKMPTIDSPAADGSTAPSSPQFPGVAANGQFRLAVASGGVWPGWNALIRDCIRVQLFQHLAR